MHSSLCSRRSFLFSSRLPEVDCSISKSVLLKDVARRVKFETIHPNAVYKQKSGVCSATLVGG